MRSLAITKLEIEYTGYLNLIYVVILNMKQLIFEMSNGGVNVGRGGGVAGPNDGRRDSKLSCVSRLSVDTLAATELGLMGKQQMFTMTAFYKVC